MFAADPTKEKMQELGSEDCCSPEVVFVAENKGKEVPTQPRDPNALVVDTVTHFGNQFDYPGARKWRTIGLFASSKQRKECLVTILAGNTKQYAK